MPEKRVAIVTGATQGIGLAVARVLSAAHFRVAIGARGAADPQVVAHVQSQLPDACLQVLDVADRSSVERFVAHVVSHLGAPTVLVNAAGVSAHATVDQLDDDEWQSVLDINLTGCMRMIRACWPTMHAEQFVRIVNIGSTAARTGAVGHSAYCASKAGLLGLTRCTAIEGSPSGITCVMVSPTWVETEMLRQSAAEIATRTGRSVASEIQAIAESNPQQRLVQPEDVARLVAYCCSNDASAVTMEDIQVNAGAHW